MYTHAHTHTRIHIYDLKNLATYMLIISLKIRYKTVRLAYKGSDSTNFYMLHIAMDFIKSQKFYIPPLKIFLVELWQILRILSSLEYWLND